MPNRIYLLIAFAFIVGAPLLVNVLSSALPTRPATENASSEAAAPIAPAPATTETQPAIQEQASGQGIGSTDPLFDAAPTMSADPVDLGAPIEPAPAPPPVRESAQEPREAAPPPPEPQQRWDAPLSPPDIPPSEHR